MTRKGHTSQCFLILYNLLKDFRSFSPIRIQFSSKQPNFQHVAKWLCLFYTYVDHSLAFRLKSLNFNKTGALPFNARCHHPPNRNTIATLFFCLILHNHWFHLVSSLYPCTNFVFMITTSIPYTSKSTIISIYLLYQFHIIDLYIWTLKLQVTPSIWLLMMIWKKKWKFQKSLTHLREDITRRWRRCWN